MFEYENFETEKQVAMLVLKELVVKELLEPIVVKFECRLWYFDEDLFFVLQDWRIYWAHNLETKIKINFTKINNIINSKLINTSE